MMRIATLLALLAGSPPLAQSSDPPPGGGSLAAPAEAPPGPAQPSPAQAPVPPDRGSPWQPQSFGPAPVPYPYAYPPMSAVPPPAVEVNETPASPEPPEPPDSGPAPSRTSWSLRLEGAQGVATGKFQNALVGGHVDYRFSTHTSLGGYLALANLKGKEGRVNAVLPCALITYESPSPGRALSFPLELATGYLTQNGPVARLAAGLAWAVGRRTDLVLSVGSMAWVTRDDMLLSINLAVELRFRRAEDDGWGRRAPRGGEGMREQGHGKL